MIYMAAGAGLPPPSLPKERRLAARKSPTRRPAASNKPAAKGAPRRAGSPPRGKPAAKSAATKKKAKAQKSSPVALPPTGPADVHPAFPLARGAAAAALDKKAENVLILDVRGLTSYADFFVLASGTSDRQVQAIADSIEETMKKTGERPLGVEGQSNGHWILIDYGDVVCHVMYEDARVHYDLEGLWADAPRISLEG